MFEAYIGGIWYGVRFFNGIHHVVDDMGNVYFTGHYDDAVQWIEIAYLDWLESSLT